MGGNRIVAKKIWFAIAFFVALVCGRMANKKKQLATKIQLFQVGLKRWRLTQTPMKHLTSSGRAVAVASQQMLELLLLLLFAFNFY